MAAAGETDGVLGVSEGRSGQVGNGTGDTELVTVLVETEADVGGGEGGETLQTSLEVQGGVDATDVSKKVLIDWSRNVETYLLYSMFLEIERALMSANLAMLVLTVTVVLAPATFILPSSSKSTPEFNLKVAGANGEPSGHCN